jgi:hypothetical protein
MKTLSLLLAAVSAAFLVSCEGHEHESGVITDRIVSSSTDAHSTSVSGTWTGRSGSGQWKSVMKLNESGGSISGTMTWVHSSNDTRSVSGTRSGSSLTLHIGGGDVWHLTVSGNKMTGTGDKAGTNRSYNLSFSR